MIRGKYNKTIRIMQINDLHIPYHDPKSLEAVYNFLQDYKPHKIIISGDFYDFYGISRFNKDPLNDKTLQFEIETGRKELEIIKSLTDEVIFIDGNHERRLKKYIWAEAPALASLQCLDFAELTGMNKLEIKHFDEKYVYESVKFHHGQYSSGHAAKKELDNYGLSTSQGHSHRLEMAMKTDGRGTIGSWNMGCLCKQDAEYINGIPNWQQGFGVFNFDKDRFFCQQIPIIKHEFIYGGKRYKSKKV